MGELIWPVKSWIEAPYELKQISKRYLYTLLENKLEDKQNFNLLENVSNIFLWLSYVHVNKFRPFHAKKI